MSTQPSTRPHSELLRLASGLRQIRPDFELSTPARDAALDHIRKWSQGKAASSDDLRNRLTELLILLPASLRSLLIRDIVDDMAGHADPLQIARIVEIAGDHVTLEDENDPDRTVRRIFSPVMGNPTERTATWMAKLVSSKLEFFRRLPVETKNEFSWRLKTALQGKEASNSAIADSLTNIAGLLDIDLTTGDEITPESSTNLDDA